MGSFPLFVGNVSFASAYILYSAVTCLLFYRRYHEFFINQRLASQLSKRNGFLTILATLSGTGIIADELYTNSYRYSDVQHNCLASFMVISFCYCIMICSLAFSALRLLLQYHHSQMVLIHEITESSLDLGKLHTSLSTWQLMKRLIKEPLTYEHTLSFNDKKRVRRMLEEGTDELRYVKWTLLNACFVTIVGFVAGAASGALKCDTGMFEKFCGVMSPNYYLLYLFLLVSIAGLCPYFLYLLRKCEDAFALRTSLAIIFGIGSINYAAYFVFSILGNTKDPASFWYAFRPVNFTLFTMMMNHVILVVIPILPESRRAKKCALQFTYSDFIRVLSNEKLYAKLKQCTIEDFSSENTLFWEKYTQLMKQVILESAQLSDRQSDYGMDERHKTIRIELDRGSTREFVECLVNRGVSSTYSDYSISTVQTSSTPEEQRRKGSISTGDGASPTIASETASKKSVIDSFNSLASLAQEPEFNASPDLVKQYLTFYNLFIDSSAPFIINIPLMTTADIMEKIKAFERKHKDPGASIKLDMQLFDVAKSQVLELIFMNTFPRFLAKGSLTIEVPE